MNTPAHMAKWKAKSIIFVLAAVATILLARNDAADSLDWFVGMIHLPSQMRAMNAQMSEGFKQIDLRLGQIERAQGIHDAASATNEIHIYDPAPVAAAKETVDP